MAEEIRYDTALRISILKSLREAFSQPTLNLTSPRDHRTPQFSINLTDGDKLVPDDRYEHVLKHIRTPDSSDTSFYFGFTAKFGESKPRCLNHASLVVFCEVCAGELVPVIRAEWDAIAAYDGASPHAQPHWHFVQTPERIERIVAILSSHKGDFVPDAPSNLFAHRAGYENCHFAMASLLDSKTGHKETYSGTEFQNWFRNMTKHVAEQVLYVAEKAPGRLKEFNPQAAP
jgi:hypothetical protein